MRSCVFIVADRFVDYLIPEIWTQVLGCPQVNLSTVEELRQFPFHGHEIQETRDGIRVKLHQKVNVAAFSEIVSERGTIKRQLPDTVTPAEIRYNLP